jgi:hypothetical protein
MMTVLEEYLTEEQRSVVRFFFLFVGKRTRWKGYKEIFPVYVGKCLSPKAFHNSVANALLATKRLKRRSYLQI